RCRPTPRGSRRRSAPGSYTPASTASGSVTAAELEPCPPPRADFLSSQPCHEGEPHAVGAEPMCAPADPIQPPVPAGEEENSERRLQPPIAAPRQPQPAPGTPPPPMSDGTPWP